MHAGMALRAKRDQIFFRIIAGVAAELFVVNLQVRHRAARLTPPAITMQHVLSQPLVQHPIQPQARKEGA
jgi:hypothetical protein